MLAPRLSLAVPALAADAIVVADALAATLAAVDLLPSVLALAVLFLHSRAESSEDSTKLNKTSARAPEGHQPLQRSLLGPALPPWTHAYALSGFAQRAAESKSRHQYYSATRCACNTHKHVWTRIR